jgi:hypothetical protein
VRAFFLSCPDFNRPPISKALPDNSSRQFFGAFHIVCVECNAVAVAEIKLGNIAVQVFLAAVLIDAFHAAFEYGIEILNGVDGYVRPAKRRNEWPPWKRRAGWPSRQLLEPRRR